MSIHQVVLKLLVFLVFSGKIFDCFVDQEKKIFFDYCSSWLDSEFYVRQPLNPINSLIIHFTIMISLITKNIIFIFQAFPYTILKRANWS